MEEDVGEGLAPSRAPARPSVPYRKHQAPPPRRRGELTAVTCLSALSLLVWVGLLQLRPVGAAAAAQPPGGAGAALVNRAVNRAVARCVRHESDPTCLAVTRKRPGLCEGDRDCLDDTYLILAVKKQGSCAKVADGEQRVICQAIRAGKDTTCLKLAGNKRVECLAVVRRDLTACDALEGAARARCRGVWHLAQAVLQGRGALCDVLPSVHPGGEAPNLLRAFCRAVVEMDPRRCQVDLRGYCKRSVPLNDLTRHACPLLEDAVLRQRCVTMYGR